MKKEILICNIIIWGLFLLFSGSCKKSSDYNRPGVTTSPVTEVTSNSAMVGGSVINDQGEVIFERGICYSTHHPTINDSKIVVPGGMWEFNCKLSGLSPNTRYFVRAYATLRHEDINNTGTGYGKMLSFITLP